MPILDIEQLAQDFSKILKKLGLRFTINYYKTQNLIFIFFQIEEYLVVQMNLNLKTQKT